MDKYIKCEHSFEIISAADCEFRSEYEGDYQCSFEDPSEVRGRRHYGNIKAKREAKSRVIEHAKEAKTPLEWRTMHHYVTHAVLRSRTTGEPLHCVKLNRALLNALADALRSMEREGWVRSYSLRPLAEELHNRPERALIRARIDDYILVDDEVEFRDWYDWHYFYED